MQPTSMAPETVSYIVLERRDPTRNMARYYVLSLEPSLFGDTALVRQWGRLGHASRQRMMDCLRSARASMAGLKSIPTTSELGG
jgi:predicted DNA-binding WGR domain protein